MKRIRIRIVALATMVCLGSVIGLASSPSASALNQTYMSCTGEFTASQGYYGSTMSSNTIGTVTGGSSCAIQSQITGIYGGSWHTVLTLKTYGPTTAWLGAVGTSLLHQGFVWLGNSSNHTPQF